MTMYDMHVGNSGMLCFDDRVAEVFGEFYYNDELLYSYTAVNSQSEQIKNSNLNKSGEDAGCPKAIT